MELKANGCRIVELEHLVEILGVFVPSSVLFPARFRSTFGIWLCAKLTNQCLQMSNFAVYIPVDLWDS
jgi:hypothetical protein